MKKIYYQLTLKQKSPLRIGSGISEISDSDLMMDVRNLPFIPGSSLAGVLREYVRKTFSKESAEQFFGSIEKKTESRLLVSDAVLPKGTQKEDVVISERDGVALNEWGTTIEGSKYNFQVAETEKSYVAVLEWTGDDLQEENEIEKLLEPTLRKIVFAGLSLGARTTRGYGMMKVVIRKREFIYPADLSAWLKFDAFEKGAFEEAKILTEDCSVEKEIRICAGIQMQGSFSVCVPTAREEKLPDGTIPNSVPLVNYEGKPVISGTSWAGVFRHHMLRLLRESGTDQYEKEKEKVNLFFGKIEQGKRESGAEVNSNVRSSIRFSETVIEGGNAHVVMRNAVERFTAAPRNMALFTNQVWQGGYGILEIVIPKNENGRRWRTLLASALIDLDLGLLTIGGESGIGRGRALIRELLVNGEDRLAQLKSYDATFLEV